MDKIYKNESGSMHDIIEKFIQDNQGCTDNEVCSWALKNTTPVEGRGHMESITRALDDLMGLNYVRSSFSYPHYIVRYYTTWTETDGDVEVIHQMRDVVLTRDHRIIPRPDKAPIRVDEIFTPEQELWLTRRIYEIMARGP